MYQFTGYVAKGPDYRDSGYNYYKSLDDRWPPLSLKDAVVFDFLNELEIRIHANTKPDGSKDFPAKSCKELKRCFPIIEDGRLVQLCAGQFFLPPSPPGQPRGQRKNVCDK